MSTLVEEYRLLKRRKDLLEQAGFKKQAKQLKQRMELYELSFDVMEQLNELKNDDDDENLILSI